MFGEGAPSPCYHVESTYYRFLLRQIYGYDGQVLAKLLNPVSRIQVILVRPCLRGIHLILLSESTQEGTFSRENQQAVNIKNIKTLLTTPSFLMRSISSRIPSSARSMFFFLFLSLISAMLEILELRCRSSSSALSSRLFSFWVSFSTASSCAEIVTKILQNCFNVQIGMFGP